MHHTFNKYVPDVSKCRHVRSPGPVWTVISRSRYAPNITIIFHMSTWMMLWMAWLPSWFSWSRSWNKYLAAGLYLQDDPEVLVREQEDWHEHMLLTKILSNHARTVHTESPWTAVPHSAQGPCDGLSCPNEARSQCPIWFHFPPLPPPSLRPGVRPLASLAQAAQMPFSGPSHSLRLLPQTVFPRCLSPLPDLSSGITCLVVPCFSLQTFQ